MRCIANNPFVLVQFVLGNRTIAIKRIPRLLLYILKLIFLFPLGIYERCLYARRISRTQITEAPIFILGHYRSGTSFLHHLLAADGRFGYFTNMDAVFPYVPARVEVILRRFLDQVAAWLRTKYYHLNHVPLRMDDPMEEDMCMVNTGLDCSPYWGYVFPRNAESYLDRFTFLADEQDRANWQAQYLYQLKKITLKCNHKPLILKSPPHTGRVRTLLQIFPNAKFIYLYRHPCEVFYSMRNLWERTIDGHYALQVIPESERERIIFSHYAKLMQQYEEDKSLIPKGHLIECRYDDLRQRPFQTLQQIYTAIGLPALREPTPRMQDQLARAAQYTPTSYTYSPETLQRIRQHWGPWVDQFAPVHEPLPASL